MPSARTTITEVITGLGMLGYDDIGAALDARPSAMVSISPEIWEQLDAWRHEPSLADSFHSAFTNGRAFLAARDALRGRIPARIEWKGSTKAPGVDPIPVDLRVDYVYLVSCKYLSKILTNTAPSNLFDDLLVARGSGRRGDWFADVAGEAYHALFEFVRSHAGVAAGERSTALDITTRQRVVDSLRDGWPSDALPLYASLIEQVSTRSAARWEHALTTSNDREAMVWRLLRLASAPYFVLGSTGTDLPLRLRIATPWDWRARYRVNEFSVFAQSGGQPRVGWRVEVGSRAGGEPTSIEGHVEIRWSHGRFSGPPEAKVYLDTPHDRVPGYHSLA